MAQVFSSNSVADDGGLLTGLSVTGTTAAFCIDELPPTMSMDIGRRFDLERLTRCVSSGVQRSTTGTLSVCTVLTNTTSSSLSSSAITTVDTFGETDGEAAARITVTDPSKTASSVTRSAVCEYRECRGGLCSLSRFVGK